MLPSLHAALIPLAPRCAGQPAAFRSQAGAQPTAWAAPHVSTPNAWHSHPRVRRLTLPTQARAPLQGDGTAQLLCRDAPSQAAVCALLERDLGVHCTAFSVQPTNPPSAPAAANVAQHANVAVQAHDGAGQPAGEARAVRMGPTEGEGEQGGDPRGCSADGSFHVSDSAHELRGEMREAAGKVPALGQAAGGAPAPQLGSTE